MQSRSRTLLAIGLLSIARLVAAQGGKYPIKEYNLSNSIYKSEKVRGPRTIKATHLNMLRYGYAWNSEVTFDKAPDLWSALTAAAVPLDTKAAPSATTLKNASHDAKHSLLLAKPQNPLQGLDQCRKDFPNSDPLYCQADGRYHWIQQKTDEIQDGAASIPTDVSRLRKASQGAVNGANAATRQLVSAGDDLKNLLQTTSSQVPAIMVAALRERLTQQGNRDSSCQITSKDSAPSTFQKGMDAIWPSNLADVRQDNDAFKLALDGDRLFIQQNGIEVSLLETQIHLRQASLRSDLAALEKQASAKKQLKDDLAKQIQSLDEALVLLASAKTALLVDTAYVDYGAKETDTTSAALSEINEAGPKYTAFHDAQQELNRWNLRMKDLNEAWCTQKDEAFSLEHDADGEFAFSQTKKTALTLTRTDLTPGAKDTKPETILDVTVECTSPFTVSAGVAFSSLLQREFAIVPSKDPNNPNNVINKFESTSTSSFHPLPLGIIHARVWEGQGWWENVGLHASFGMAGNFRSQNSGGSDVEFLVGPSVSLFRTMFLTPGLHIGHKVELGGGFKEGDVVPPSITQPPLQKSYKLGFGLAITFTKP